jgi:hypothetical protein
MPNCLNCEAELHGPFCGGCGQRVVPRYPTLREMASDAWHEFSGWDGRFSRTLRMLIHPGLLTLEVLEGRRARYVSPLRLYLAASVMFFLISAAAPSLRRPQKVELPGGGKNIDLMEQLSPEDRALAQQQIDRAPWWVRPVMQSFLDDREGQIRAFRETLPRALFLLLPVFAGIVSMFFRRRRFSQHLIFALHLHATTFVLFSLVQPLNLTKNQAIVSVAGILMFVVLVVYALKAFRRVYQERWVWILLKSAAIAPLYLATLVVGMIGTYAWTLLT